MAAAESSSKANKASLPPGIVLGPDGKPCKICTGFSAWTKAYGKQGSKPAPSAAAATSAAAAAALASSPTASDEPPADCPADVERLGRHTWTLLHTSAAYYPDTPSKEQQSAMRTFIHALPLLYPCSHCADDLKHDLQQDPPDVSSRARLSRWMCVLHNGVNRKLGKDEFDCSRIDQRWRDGWRDGRCDL